MICPFCKNILPLGSDFCIYCGNQIQPLLDEDDYEDRISIEEDENDAYEFVDDDFDEDFTDDYNEYDDSYDDYENEGWGDGTDGDYNY